MATPDENGWFTMESAPKDGTMVLVSGFVFDTPTEGRWVTAGEYLSGEWLEIGGTRLYTPTHWQPIPKPPVGA